MQSLIPPSSLHHNYYNNGNKKPMLSLLPQFSFISNNKPKSPFSQLLLSPPPSILLSSSSACIVHAAKNDSQKFEIDPDEAKQALQKLDQQLQTISEKQVSSPKIRAANVKLTRDQAEGEQTVEISESFLTKVTVGLFIFTIFYNILFYKVIKPSIDGPDDVPAPAPVTSMATESPNATAFQSRPPNLEDEDPLQR